MTSVPSTKTSMILRGHRQRIAAVRTLERMGYTYHDGELWKPPLGAAPVGMGQCQFIAVCDPACPGNATSAPAVGYCTTHHSYNCNKVPN